ncbi:MAG: hypothetical protein L0Z50_27030, partial [Verrucomicrobiales bacterium]|nr:hypothetical protein [Verrucomicrobiales bacterium]
MKHGSGSSQALIGGTRESHRWERSRHNELLRCYVQEGSEKAFAELVERHIDVLFSAALRET